MKSTIDITLQYAIFLSHHMRNCDISCATTAVLLDLGIPTKGMGFDYLKNAIVLLMEDPGQTFIKGLYPAVGKCYDPKADSHQIEATIRRTITAAWKNRDENLWDIYFPWDAGENSHRPTNAEFITGVVRFLELLQGCSEEGAYE